MLHLCKVEDASRMFHVVPPASSVSSAAFQLELFPAIGVWVVAAFPERDIQLLCVFQL